MKLDLSRDLYKRLCSILAPDLTLSDAPHRAVVQWRRAHGPSLELPAGSDRAQLRYRETWATEGMAPAQLRGCLGWAVSQAEARAAERPKPPPPEIPACSYVVGGQDSDVDITAAVLARLRARIATLEAALRAEGLEVPE